MIEFSNAKTYGVFSTPESRQIIKQLREANADYLEFPAASISVSDNLHKPKFDSDLIDSADWLIFFEPAAVGFFLAELKAMEYDLYSLDGLRICTLGELTADALRFEQIHTDIILEIYEQSAFGTISDFLGTSQSFDRQKILIIRNNLTDLKFENEILSNNPTTQIIKVCQSLLAETNFAKNKILLKNGAVDELIFTSPDDLITLRHYFSDFETMELKDLKFVSENENLWRFINGNGLNCQLLS